MKSTSARRSVRPSVRTRARKSARKVAADLLASTGVCLCFIVMGCGQEQTAGMTEYLALMSEDPKKAEIVPPISNMCSCKEMRKSKYACETAGRIWPGCVYTAPDESTSIGRCTARVVENENHLYNSFNSCMELLLNMTKLNATELWPSKYSEIRCCLGNKGKRHREECVRYHCAEKLLLDLPYVCQTNFFRIKDTLCRMDAEDSILKDCHATKCEIPLLKYNSQDMFNLLAAASISTFVCAIAAAVYTKRKRKRMLEWAKLEGRVLGGDGVAGDGGEDHLVDALAQKERRARTWYYVSKQGKVVGPLKEEDMRLRKVAGLFDHDLMVRVNDSDWNTLSKFYANPELEAFEAKTRPQIPCAKK